MSPWQSALSDLAASAPPWMRALASEELHIGGFTNVQLAHPVLDLRAVQDEAQAECAAVWFCATALAGGAAVARLHCQSATRSRALAARLRRDLRGALLRLDDESAALMRYFDVYLKPTAEIADTAGRRALEALRRALDAAREADETGTLDRGTRLR